MALTEGECDRPGGIASESTLNLRIDNDIFGAHGQDQGYTNGFLLTLVSPNLLNFANDPCLPNVARQVNHLFSSLQPSGYDELNMTVGFGQMMYTPSDPQPSELIIDDRPYAGALMFSVGYNARKDSYLQSALLRLGWVGPAAKAGEVQNWWHDIIGVDRFNGWDNQLQNEPVFQFIVERRKRMATPEVNEPWRWDLIAHAGGSVGNFATYFNTGLEYRFGYLVPDDFGTAPLRPAGENTSPIRATANRDWLGHFFIALDARWVLHDITLDGNTFKSSHSVEKQPFVADIGYSLAITQGDWRFAFARYYRTREFEGQHEPPAFGSFTVGVRF
ncbi:MAG: lipid A deacylase LpxR family protein [Pseudomonadales bacterium]|nr:lipid A deacylase LpxR family protein [Pseudomonadales bacterium]